MEDIKSGKAELTGERGAIMTQVEKVVDEALSDLKFMRGGLTLISSETEDPGDYLGLCGRLQAMVEIVEKGCKTLDDVITSLYKIAPKGGCNLSEAGDVL